MSKRKQSNFIACWKMLNICFIKNFISSERGGVYSVLVDYQSLLKSRPISPPHLSFSIKYRRKRLLLASFLKLWNFVIYQLANKRIEILPLAISYIAPLCNQFNYVFALLVSTPLLKALIFIKIDLKLSYFCKKLQNFKIFKLPKQPPIADFRLHARSY